MSVAPREKARPEGDRLAQRVLSVCDAVGDYIEAWGFRSIHGRVWTLLALSRGPVAQADIADRLGVSRSLVHLAVTELTQYGLVRATSAARNAPIEANLDVWPTITDVIRGREWMLIERARVALEAALAEAEFLGEESPYDPERIRLLLAMTGLAQSVLRTVLAVPIPRSLEAFAKWVRRASKTINKLEDTLALLS
ncbi:MAG: MarR family transcriptional regulator [Deltaproteobacteria bacterium]|nr:MarR family transcriptional regulator [Deltaproteobacteria bacterium]